MALLTQTDLFDGESFTVDWKHVTHAGGKGEYLHDWYAYLEGYSSEFVRKVRIAYMPSSSLIIDPFAGVGTTPITLGLEGIGSSYCELNPAMRKVISAKLTVSALPEKKKRELCAKLIALADNLPDLVFKKPKCDDLQIAYKTAFNSSVFFYPEAYDLVLRLRSLNNELSKSDHLHRPALDLHEGRWKERR